MIFTVLCETTEYYVKPTDNSTVPCPGQPCLTINQYTNFSGKYLETNNSVFTFLPGIHKMQRPMEFQSVSNVTVRASDNNGVYILQPVQSFKCQNKNCINVTFPDRVEQVCCSTLRMVGVSNVTIRGLTVASAVHNVSGIIITQSTNIKVLQNTIQFEASPGYNEIGVMVVDSSYVLTDVLKTKHFKVGVLLLRTSHLILQDSETTHSQGDGLVMIQTANSNISSVKVNDSMVNGIFLYKATYSFIEDVHVNITGVNAYGGIVLWSCTKTTMLDVSSNNNKKWGIILQSGNKHTTMKGITVSYNHKSGLVVQSSDFTTLCDIITRYNQEYGIYILNSNDSIIRGVYATNNNRGILATGVKIVNISRVIAHNNENGIILYNYTNITLIDVQAYNNTKFGIGTYFGLDTVLWNIHIEGNSIEFQRCSNVCITNLSLNYIQVHGLSLYQCTDILIEESSFSEVKLLPSLSNAAWPAIISIYNTSILAIKNCNFTNNRISSIVATTTSIIRVEGFILFENISVISGAAFVFSESSVLLVPENSTVVFRNNFASQYGAAFYIFTEAISDISMLLINLIYQQPDYNYIVTSKTECFVRVKRNATNTTRFIFINNTSVEGGDVLYGGQIAAGYDGDWNCLLSFKNISDMTDQSSGMEYRRITSTPSRVCICHDTSPDCLIVVDPRTHDLYPGETISINAAVVGQDFGTISGDIYAQLMESEHGSISVGANQKMGYNGGMCKLLNYTLFSDCEDCKTALVLTVDRKKVFKLMHVNDNDRLNESWHILQSVPDYNELAAYFFHEFFKHDKNAEIQFVFTKAYYTAINKTIDDFFMISSEKYDISHPEILKNKLRFPQQIYTYPLYINIQFSACPIGFTLSQHKCDCIKLLQQMSTVKCDIQDQTIARAGSVWVGIDANETIAGSQHCPLNYCKNESIKVTLQDKNATGPDSQCNYKRSGILCGGCQPGLSLALGSEQCLHCSNAYISLIIPITLAGFLLVFFIKVLDLTVCQGTINGLIFYSNIISANKHLYYNQSDTNPITLFIAWFNLDLGIETCFYDGLTAYARTWLQFVFPIYIWCIAGAIIILANHSKRVAAISGNNGVPVLATLFLLSYAKLFNAIISVLSYTILYTSQGQRLVWTTDGNIDYLGPEHAPLFVVAVAVLLFLWLPYTLILLFGKYLHKLNCHLISRYLLKLKPFLDANYAPFHDRHQYWFGVILVVKAVILFSSAIIPTSSGNIVVLSVALTTLLLTYWGHMVFRNVSATLLHTSFFANLAALNITKLFVFYSTDDITIASYTIIGLTLVQFSGLCLFKCVKFSISKWHNQANCCIMNVVEDDWEPYLQAALLRGKESDDEHSDLCESMESLPTY